jgi:hypothetical protein
MDRSLCRVWNVAFIEEATISKQSTRFFFCLFVYFKNNFTRKQHRLAMWMTSTNHTMTVYLTRLLDCSAGAWDRRSSVTLSSWSFYCRLAQLLTMFPLSTSLNEQFLDGIFSVKFSLKFIYFKFHFYHTLILRGTFTVIIPYMHIVYLEQIQHLPPVIFPFLFSLFPLSNRV